METTLARCSYRGFLTIGFVLVFCLVSFAQPSPTATARDLNATLADIARIAPATIQDLDLAGQQQGGRLHRVEFWRGNKAFDPQTAKSLHRNLQFAVPTLIHDTQASGGNISTSFKLYRDLTSVCDSLSSLLRRGENRTEFSALNNDLSDMNRLREDLYSYIEQRAAAIDARNSQIASAGHSPKKVVVYNDMPDSSSPGKRHFAGQ